MRRFWFIIVGLATLCAIGIFIAREYTGIPSRLNQERAVTSLRSIRAAQLSFKSTKGVGKYGTLDELAAAKLIDPTLASGIKNGYRFEVRVKNGSFEAVAVPLKDKYWSFYLDESGVIRGTVKDGAEANASDQPVRHQ